jgi:hypothetical protein
MTSKGALELARGKHGRFGGKRRGSMVILYTSVRNIAKHTPDAYIPEK